MSNASTVPTVGRPEIAAQYEDNSRYPSGIAYMDGQYLPMSQAKISVLDWGLLHSDATYDTVHVWDGRFFRLDLHLDRFFNGLEKLRMSINLSREEVTTVLQNCVGLSGHRSAYVEMICTRGSSPTFSRDPRDAINRFIAFAIPFGSVANAEQLKRGLHVAISSTVRIPPASVDPTIKNYHWLDLVKGLYDAYDQKAETALILDFEGNIAEGPGFNVFAVRGGQVSTPAKNVLPGITRRSVLDICSELQIPVAEKAVSQDDLFGADEIFITSTAGGVMPVTKVNERSIGTGSVGEITKTLMDEYWKRHSDPKWSTPISYFS
ncbi:aminotransferase class IV [Rhizobium hainanense]|uniref:Probable branched-chain-amino-acid aminotransferase n=1 Tax=Rhizobium hainanense TaxID=52131 RepID=A0A1C3WCE5_9HYPH|nr:aminotransferase class IV [Rhizobium hainanense]SCB37623.1 branched-chain amino acid aminotransferase [Rhizobium hainanense]